MSIKKMGKWYNIGYMVQNCNIVGVYNTGIYVTKEKKE